MTRIVIVAVCLVLFLGCAHQDDVIILDQRLAKMEKLGKELDQKTRRLENDYTEMSQRDEQSYAAFEKDSEALGQELSESKTRLEKENQRIRGQYAGINAQIVELQDELQGVRGNLEETDYMVRQRMDTSEELGREIQVRFDKMAVSLEKMEGRIQYIEQYLDLEPGQVQAPPSAAIVTDNKKLSDADLYTSAKQAFDQGDFETAKKSFNQIITEYPKSEHADNAQFWIGEIYYREKWYEKAILEYQKVIENYPKGNKVPASLLKQGFAFLSLGDKANARLILNELAKKYPNTNEGKIAAQKLKEIS
ncbi:MAG: tol-pal system protein YbgF [Thermodesulfobacteriota bacterium]